MKIFLPSEGNNQINQDLLKPSRPKIIDGGGEVVARRRECLLARQSDHGQCLGGMTARGKTRRTYSRTLCICKGWRNGLE
jgi:hypothetical protein